MKCWALEKEGLSEADSWRWELAGLLHDADWDQWPELHCKKIIEKLEPTKNHPARAEPRALSTGTKNHRAHTLGGGIEDFLPGHHLAAQGSLNA